MEPLACELVIDHSSLVALPRADVDARDLSSGRVTKAGRAKTHRGKDLVLLDVVRRDRFMVLGERVTPRAEVRKQPTKTEPRRAPRSERVRPARSWLAAAALAAMSSPATSTHVAPGTTSGNELTVFVMGGDKGIADAKYLVAIELTDGEETVTVTSPGLQWQSSEGFAGALAATLDELGVRAAVKETRHPRFVDSPRMAEDIELGLGWRIEHVQLTQLTPQDAEPGPGRLGVLVGRRAIVSPDDDTGARRGLSTLSFFVQPSEPLPLTLELDLYGFEDEEWHHSVSYSAPYENPLEGLAEHLEGLGMRITYPSPREMTAVVPDDMEIERASFFVSQPWGEAPPEKAFVRYRLDAD